MTLCFPKSHNVICRRALQWAVVVVFLGVSQTFPAAGLPVFALGISFWLWAVEFGIQVDSGRDILRMGAALVLFIFSLLPTGETTVLMAEVAKMAVIFQVVLISSGLTAHEVALYERRTTSDGMFLFLVGSTVFILSLVCIHYVSEGVPHQVDGMNQIFHAKMLAEGKLAIPYPAFGKFIFMFHMIIREGLYYSQYPPGFLLLLAAGLKLGAVGLVNPLLAGLTVVPLYLAGKKLYGQKIARITGYLFLFCPFIVFMASDFLSHVAALFFYAVFLAGWAYSRDSARFFPGLVSGLGLGCCFATRPWTAAALAVFPLVDSLRNLRLKKIPTYSGFFLGVGILVFLVGLYNYATNGSPWVFGYVQRYGNSHLPGFGHAAWGPPHTVSRGIFFMQKDLNGLNRFLFEWPLPSLTFVFLLFFLRGASRVDRVLLFSSVALSMAYGGYFFEEWTYGPRFLFEAAVPLLLLTARGLVRSGTLIPRGNRRAVFFGLVVAGIIFSLPDRIEEYSHRYRGITGSNLKLARGLMRFYPGRKFIFLVPDLELNGVLSQNSPHFDNPGIFVREFDDAENRQLFKAFPDRTPVYLSQGKAVCSATP